MNTQLNNLSPNLSTRSEIRHTFAFSLKRLLLCSVAWGAVLVLAAAIAVAQSSPTPPTQRADGAIETDVVQAIDNSEILKGEPITVATIQGEVTLSGTVTSEGSRQLAQSLAADVPGVTRVQNNLKVTAGSSVQSAAAYPQPHVRTESDPAPDQGAPAQDSQQSQTPIQSQAQPQTPPQRPAYAPKQTTAQAPQYSDLPVPPEPGNQSNNQDNNQDNLPPYPNTAPNPPSPYGAQNSQHPQQPQPAPYGAHAPEPPYDPTPITVLKGVSIDLRTNQFLDNKSAKNGTTFDLSVVRDVYIAGRLAIPRGAVAHGVVVESKSSGDLGGAPSLALKLVSIDLGPNNYPLSTDLFLVRGPNKAGYSAGNIVGGTALGAMIGAIVGRGPGAAIGAVAGAATGTAVSAGTPGPRAWIPAEALVTFRLQDSVTVVPVTPQEATRLAQSVMPAPGPTLYTRPAPGYYAGYAPGYAPGYYAPGYAYPYSAPMPFYHPYYVVGGYYYWR